MLKPNQFPTQLPAGSETLSLTEFADFDRNYGIILIKPDAVNLDLTEYLIEEIRSKLPSKYNPSVEVIRVHNFASEEEVASLFGDLAPEFYSATMKYMLSGPSVIVVYKNRKLSPASFSFINLLKELKGKTMYNWTVDQIINPSTVSFVRGMLPVPGTRYLYEPIIRKILDNKTGVSTERFTEDEIEIYVQNLIHTPDCRGEVNALLTILYSKNLVLDFEV